MARTTDPVCQLCRREGIKLFLKGSRCDSPSARSSGATSPPGMHGYRRGKPTEYGIRLREKQKLKHFYGVLERQFRRYFELASRSPENTGEVLLSMLERRLDNVVHRLGFGRQPGRGPATGRARPHHGQRPALQHPQLLRQGGRHDRGQEPAAAACSWCKLEPAGQPAAGPRLPGA